MSTTTIRMPEALKERVAEAAERAGISPHGFILEAIAEKADNEERRREFDAVAEQRYADIVLSGRVVAWSEMRPYLVARAAGAKVKRPAAKKLAR